MKLFEGFVCHPAVCAVGENYQIIVPVKYDMLFSVQVGEKEYFNHSNGIIISSSPVQRVTVPMKELDREKKYTVKCRKMIERKPYFSQTGRLRKITYEFRPVEKTENIRIYHLADTHGKIGEPVGAAEFFGKDIDLLILNGDIADSSESEEYIFKSYILASKITGGSVPCVISRGNHDLRGQYAEFLSSYMPNRNGSSYYTFRLGCIWGILVDCGEDKEDPHCEYGHTVCCHQMRQEETEYIKETILNAEKEYNAEGIKYRLVISHVPFTMNFKIPFNIEKKIYDEWCSLLGEYVKPHLMLSGHLHRAFVSPCGSKVDYHGQPCTLLVGSEVDKHRENSFYGMGVTLSDGKADVVFNSQSEIKEENTVNFSTN